MARVRRHCCGSLPLQCWGGPCGCYRNKTSGTGRDRTCIGVEIQKPKRRKTMKHDPALPFELPSRVGRSAGFEPARRLYKDPGDQVRKYRYLTVAHYPCAALPLELRSPYESDWGVRGRLVTLVIPLRFRLFRMPPIMCPVCYFLTWFRFHNMMEEDIT